MNNPQSTCLTICGVCTAVGPTSSLYSARHPGQASLPGADLLVEHADTEKAAIAALVVFQAASAARTETLRVNRVAAIGACGFGAARKLNSEISAEAEQMRAALEKHIRAMAACESEISEQVLRLYFAALASPPPTPPPLTNEQLLEQIAEAAMGGDSAEVQRLSSALSRQRTLPGESPDPQASQMAALLTARQAIDQKIAELGGPGAQGRQGGSGKSSPPTSERTAAAIADAEAAAAAADEAALDEAIAANERHAKAALLFTQALASDVIAVTKTLATKRAHEDDDAGAEALFDAGTAYAEGLERWEPGQPSPALPLPFLESLESYIILDGDSQLGHQCKSVHLRLPDPTGLASEVPTPPAWTKASKRGAGVPSSNRANAASPPTTGPSLKIPPEDRPLMTKEIYSALKRSPNLTAGRKGGFNKEPLPRDLLSLNAPSPLIYSGDRDQPMLRRECLVIGSMNGRGMFDRGKGKFFVVTGGKPNENGFPTIGIFGAYEDVYPHLRVPGRHQRSYESLAEALFGLTKYLHSYGNDFLVSLIIGLHPSFNGEDSTGVWRKHCAAFDIDVNRGPTSPWEKKKQKKAAPAAPEQQLPAAAVPPRGTHRFAGDPAIDSYWSKDRVEARRLASAALQASQDAAPAAPAPPPGASNGAGGKRSSGRSAGGKAPRADSAEGGASGTHFGPGAPPPGISPPPPSPAALVQPPGWPPLGRASFGAEGSMSAGRGDGAPASPPLREAGSPREEAAASARVGADALATILLRPGELKVTIVDSHKGPSGHFVDWLTKVGIADAAAGVGGTMRVVSAAAPQGPSACAVAAAAAVAIAQGVASRGAHGGPGSADFDSTTDSRLVRTWNALFNAAGRDEELVNQLSGYSPSIGQHVEAFRCPGTGDSCPVGLEGCFGVITAEGPSGLCTASFRHESGLVVASLPDRCLLPLELDGSVPRGADEGSFVLAQNLPRLMALFGAASVPAIACDHFGPALRNEYLPEIRSSGQSKIFILNSSYADVGPEVHGGHWVVVILEWVPPPSATAAASTSGRSCP